MAKRTPAPPEPEPADETTVKLNIPCPIALHRKLRVRAAMDDMSQKDVVLTALEEYLA